MQVTGNNYLLNTKSISLSIDGLSFFSKEKTFSKTWDTKDHSFFKQRAELMCNKELVSLAAEPLSIIIEDKGATLMPKDMFSSEDAKQMFGFQFPKTNLQHILLKEDLNEYGIRCVFAVRKDLYRFLTTQFPQASIYHIDYLVLKELLKQSKNKGNTQVGAFINHSMVAVYVVSMGKLLFANSFDIKGKDDTLYYIANTYEQFALSQRETPLNLFGKKEEKKNLKAYFAKIV